MPDPTTVPSTITSSTITSSAIGSSTTGSSTTGSSTTTVPGAGDEVAEPHAGLYGDLANRAAAAESPVSPNVPDDNVADQTAVTGQPPAEARVAIVMGSDSDWPTMQAAAEALDEFDVAWTADVISAHRMPDDMVTWGRAAHLRGIRVVIAGAGGAAHLPGMLASLTPLPVIGVPVPLKHLDGMDSLLSIVQMPAGVPVATVSIAGARNAGLLAVRILAQGDDELTQRMLDFQASLRRLALDKGERVRQNNR